MWLGPSVAGGFAQVSVFPARPEPVVLAGQAAFTANGPSFQEEQSWILHFKHVKLDSKTLHIDISLLDPCNFQFQKRNSGLGKKMSEIRY